MSQIKQIKRTKSSTTVTMLKVKDLILAFFERISDWLWFIVISAMIPLLFQGWLINESENLSLLNICQKTTSHGELIQLSLALLAGSFADLMSLETKYNLTKKTFSGLCFCLLILVVMAYTHYFADPYSTLGNTKEAFQT
ncbi:MAG: hypothetical protein AAGA80_21905, partial [Cyanobacteria bacterium P01_F01_bin.143]